MSSQNKRQNKRQKTEHVQKPRVQEPETDQATIQIEQVTKYSLNALKQDALIGQNIPTQSKINESGLHNSTINIKQEVEQPTQQPKQETTITKQEVKKVSLSDKACALTTEQKTTSEQPKIDTQIKIEQPKKLSNLKLSNQKSGDLQLTDMKPEEIAITIDEDLYKGLSKVEKTAFDSFQQFFRVPAHLPANSLEQCIRIFKSKEKFVPAEGELTVQDIEYQEQYFEMSTNKNQSKLKKLDKGEMPQIFRDKILNKTSKDDYTKIYLMEVRSVLNKFTDEQIEKVWLNLVKILVKTLETVKKPEERYNLFQIMVYEMFDKACIEKKFVQMYAQLILKATLSKSYEDPKFDKETKTTLTKFRAEIISHFVKMQDQKESQGLLQIVKKELLLKCIVEEVKNGVSSVFMAERPNETAQEKEERINIGKVHFNGCLEFVSHLYLFDKDNKLIDDTLLASLQVGLLSKEVQEVARLTSQEPPKITINTIQSDLQLMDKIRYLVKLANEAKLQLECQSLRGLTRVLELTHKKQTSKNAPDTAKFVFEAVRLFNKDITPSFIFHKIHDQIFSQHVKQAEDSSSQKSEGKWTLETLLEEWLETSLEQTLERLFGGKLTDNFDQNTKKLIQFFNKAFDVARQDRFIAELPRLFKQLSKAERQSLCLEFAKNFCQILKTEAQLQRQDMRKYKSMFKFVSIQLQDNLDFYQLMDLLDQDMKYSFLFQLMKTTIEITFDQTLMDSYSDLLNEQQLKETKLLIADGQFYKVTQLKYLQQLFIQEKFGCFAEPDAQPLLHELMTPFDQQTIEKLQLILKIEANNDQQIKLNTAKFASIIPQQGEKNVVPLKLFYLFEQLQFDCGIQVFNFLKLTTSKIDRPERKLRMYLLEQHIKSFVKENKVDDLKLFFQEHKQIALAVLDKSYLVCKDNGGQIVNILNMCEKVDVKRLKQLIAAKKVERKNYGLLPEVVTWGEKK